MGLKEYSKVALSEMLQVFDRMEDSDIQPALDALINAKKVVCYGAGREGLGLKFFVMRLMHLGKDAHWAMEDTAPSVGKGDVFFISCGPGFYSHVVFFAELAKKAGAKVVTVTAAPDSDIGKVSDVVCWLPAMAWRAKGDLVPTRQPMGNLYEQSAVILFDVMARMLKQQMDVSDEEMEKRHRNYE
jgi:6-phospho-3-hexuloisomerase